MDLHNQPPNSSSRKGANIHQSPVTEQSEDFPVRSNFTLHLILNLRFHERKLLVQFARAQIPTDFHKLLPGFVDFALADQLTWRVRHEGKEAENHDHTPGNLHTERQTPLNGAVRCIAACIPDPVGHHGSEGDPATGNTANQAAELWRADLGEINGDSSDHASARRLRVSRTGVFEQKMTDAPVG